MDFDIEKTIQYWRESASYDLETGKSLKEFARQKFNEIEEVYQWLSQRLNK